MSEAKGLLDRLRRGEPIEADLPGFCAGLASGDVSEAQGAAFAMGACLRGLGDAETVALTLAMRDSGRVLEWRLDGPVVDKHSTGGLGDATSLLVAPILAAEGAYAPLLSGRGLGHTGGTLDKLEAIPGVSTDLDAAGFQALTARAGCAVAGAGGDIAPADRVLYGLRDHTSTVEDVALIVASILSKKLAAGADALVLDVKTGSGAFMTDRHAAEALARRLVDVAGGAGLPAAALVTDMAQPLAPAVGNALEIAEVVGALATPDREARLCQLSAALAGQALALAGMAESAEAGVERAWRALFSGAAAERFAAMVAGLGGPADLIQDPSRHLPAAPVRRDVAAPSEGVLTAIDGRALGWAVVDLGGGRRAPQDAVDPAVGLDRVARLGAAVGPGRPLARIHARDEDAADAAAETLRAAMIVADADAPTAEPPALIVGRVP